ncbi:hypothetical protein BH23ACT10_BH23ACT10_01270 [soil metagenome]
MVCVLGLLGRFGGVDAVPTALQRADVLAVAAVLYSLEFVADKIPWLDSTWDAVHTAIRPVVGAAIGLLLAGDATSVEQALAAAGGGLSALASHAVKAGLRAAVNTSPEPASNIAVSVAEDVTVAGLISLAVAAPWLAASIAALLLSAGLVIVIAVASRVRRYRQRRRQRDTLIRTRSPDGVRRES